MLRPARLVPTLVLIATFAGRATGQPASRVDALVDAGAYAQAEREGRAALSASTAAQADSSPALIDALVRALLANGRASERETIELATRALAAHQSRAGVDAPDLIVPLANLAEALAADGQLTRAVDLARRATALQQRHEIRGARVVDALDVAGHVLSAARRHDEALAVFERSLRVREADGARGAALAHTLDGMALVLQRQGLYVRSGLVARRSLAERESDGASHPAFVSTLNLLAQQLWFEGDLSGSREASERAVALATKTLRADHPALALSLRYLAATMFDLGEAASSHALTERAREIAERAFGPRHHQTADYVNDLGVNALFDGRYPEARRLLRQALEIYRSKYGPYDERVASARSALAQVEARMGNYAQAQAEQARAVAIHSRAGGANHPFVAIALSELAAVYREQGRPRSALPLLERALAIRERSVGREHPDVARTLADLAEINARLGRPTRAERLASRALAIFERADTPDAPEFATVLALYAGIRASRGDHHGSREAYQRALQIRARAFGTMHPVYAETMGAQAPVLARLGDIDGALEAARVAESTGREHLRLMMRSLPERQALQYAAARARGFDVVASVAVDRPAAATLALDLAVRSRALVLDEMAARRAAIATVTLDAAAAREALNAAQQRLANLLVRGVGALSTAQYGRLVEEARRAREAAESDLAGASEGYRSERLRTQLGVDDVQQAIPGDAALVALVRFNRSPVPAGAPDLALPRDSHASYRPVDREAATPMARPTPSYLALIARRGHTPVAVDLGSARTVDRLVSRWRADLAAIASLAAVPTVPLQDARASGAALRRVVWDPIAALIGDVERVFIVPDGSLSLVPFAALPTTRGRFLLETGPTIHYLSAERDIVPLPAATTNRGLLAVGGPSFDIAPVRSRRDAATALPSTTLAPSTGCGNLLGVSFSPLAGTVREVREISRVWNTESESHGDARVLLGPAAREEDVKRLAGEQRILHIATHGFFLDGSCNPVASGTRGVGGLTATQPTRVENPLLLSGLALAGANRRAQARADEDDGILTAEEVAMLDLQGVEWAVLSACDTGVGEVRAGEGVFGLRRAFQVAGARTVIMSLWSVDDRATRAWMRALYEGRFQGRLSTADAVRQASLTVLRDRRARGLSTHPFYWAAFLAAGDWR